MMKHFRISMTALLLLLAFGAISQNEYPQQNTDYLSSWEEDYRGDGYVTYTYYLENTSDETLAFYNFKIKPDEERYEILRSYPTDLLILYPHQKNSYLQVKVYSSGPGFTWNSKFLKPTKETSSYPIQNKDYVYYWKSDVRSDESTYYSYHLINISTQNIKFYDFTLTNNGGIYYLIDNLLQNPVVAEPGESIQIVKYNHKSGETPSANWYADWSSFGPSGDAFCTGLNKVLEAAKEEGFASIKGGIKQKSNDSDTFFDIYYCKEHIDGVNNEGIEDLLFFWEYTGQIGSPAPLDIINSRFYEYRSKIESCLPNFPKRDPGDDKPEYLKVEFEAEVDYLFHYIRLEVVPDYSTSNYFLELVVEEVY